MFYVFGMFLPPSSFVQCWYCVYISKILDYCLLSFFFYFFFTCICYFCLYIAVPLCPAGGEKQPPAGLGCPTRCSMAFGASQRGAQGLPLLWVMHSKASPCQLLRKERHRWLI